eukprot:5872140-Pyramimonas_sp.AAC.1
MHQKWCFGTIQDYAGTTHTLIRGVGDVGRAFWHASRSPRRKSQIDPWCWKSENNILAFFRAFKRVSSNEAVPSTEMNHCRGL